MAIRSEVSQHIRKLRKMSAGEIGCRLRELWRLRVERRWYRLACRRGVEDRAANGQLRLASGRLLEAARMLVPGTQRKDLAKIGAERPELHERLASSAHGRADAVLSGNWPLLGHSVDLRGQIDWHRDPRSEHRWSRAFYADVLLHIAEGGAEGGSPRPTFGRCPAARKSGQSPARKSGQPPSASRGVDVKYVWELGRQQYLAELARGWLLAREERFAEQARTLMLDWIQCNPLYEGVHWTSALEVAMRAISWIWTVAALAEWDGWQPGDLEHVAASLADHATYLEHHFSFYSSPYNHLIGEATGLYLAALALREFGESERWRRRAREVLAEHGPRQFYADGFTVEQATGYHFYTLGFLSLAIAAARRAGEPLGDLEEVAHRAFRAGAAFQQPDGRWPAIGDVDSARSIPVLHDDFWDFRSLMSLGAVLFDDPTLKAGCDSPGEELYWLLGCEGVEHWHSLPQKAAPSHVVLKDSGYAVARAGGDWLLFDAGPIAAGVHADATPSTAHGHADALQVLVCLAGKPLLLDAGMPFYVGPADWVRHFRGPAAHNTLEIEGVEIAHYAGSLDWSHVAGRPQLNANLSEEVWLARGRAEWGPGVVVERNLLMLPSRGLWIADYIQTDRPRRVRWYWQLPEGMARRVEEDGTTRCLVAGDRISLATSKTRPSAGARRAMGSATGRSASARKSRRRPGYWWPHLLAVCRCLSRSRLAASACSVHPETKTCRRNFRRARRKRKTPARTSSGGCRPTRGFGSIGLAVSRNSPRHTAPGSRAPAIGRHGRAAWCTAPSDTWVRRVIKKTRTYHE